MKLPDLPHARFKYRLICDFLALQNELRRAKVRRSHIHLETNANPLLPSWLPGASVDGPSCAALRTHILEIV